MHELVWRVGRRRLLKIRHGLIGFILPQQKRAHRRMR
jgi:hypothetical protein